MRSSNLLAGHQLCAVDVETTGLVPHYHEIIQIAIVPLKASFRLSDKRAFYLEGIAPDFPARQDKGALFKTGIEAETLLDCVSQDKAADLLLEWFEGLKLPPGKRLIPLAHNWGFEKSMLTAWLGPSLFNKIWDGRARDSMACASFINDIHNWQSEEAPFAEVNLTSVTRRLGINLVNAHNALADAIATAQCYAAMIQLFG